MGWTVGRVAWPPVSECVITIHAAATGNTYSPPRASINLDEAGMSNPCGLDVDVSPSFVLLIPAGTYSGATATIEWGDGASAECILTVEDDGGSTFVDDDVVTGTTPVNLSVPAFTIAAQGRAYITADFSAVGGTHTISPSTVLTITKTG